MTGETIFIVRVFMEAEVLPSDELIRRLRLALRQMERLTADGLYKGANDLEPDDDFEGTFVEGWESLYV